MNESTVFLNEVAEWNVEDNAHIRHYKLQDGHNAELGVSNSGSEIARDATFTSVLLSLSGEMLRNNLSLNINASNCVGNMYGLYLLNGKRTLTTILMWIIKCLIRNQMNFTKAF